MYKQFLTVVLCGLFVLSSMSVVGCHKAEGKTVPTPTPTFLGQAT